MSSAGKDSNGAWRFELKYRLSYPQYYKIRSALRPYIKPDHFTAVAPEGKYLVRTLYFETHDYRAYYEKMNGDSERIKLRLRTYTDSIDNNPAVRVELKVRKANTMEKYGTFISTADYLYFMQWLHWPVEGDPVLDEFKRYLHLKELRPQVLVEYRREGYVSRSKDEIRITLDHRVQSAHAATLFPPKHVFFRAHHPHSVVLEVKCRHNRPAWLRNMVQDYGLKVVANSKYTQGIQVARQDLYYPDGVVVVR